jgi:hypothetical protein
MGQDGDISMRIFQGIARLPAIAVLMAGAALANDSSSELAAGGLMLVKTDAITMQREDLSLSLSEVRVRYEMRNDTGKPVTLRVAFPMPEVPTMGGAGLDTSTGHNILIHPWRNANFVNFRVVANGQEVAPEKELRAVLPDGKDVTADVLAIGGERLALHPGWFQTDADPKDAEDPVLDAKAMARLKEIGALTQEDTVFVLQWHTTVTFHWMQTFQPGVTVVEHMYRPVLGSHLVDTDGPSKVRVSGTENAEATYCIDDPTRRAVVKLLKGTDTAMGTVEGITLAYILKTARNWHGPIGTFHLTIQGGQGVGDATIAKNVGETSPATPDVLPAKPGSQIISLCTDLPIHRTGPLRFEATVDNYVPADDLNILFVEGVPHSP